MHALHERQDLKHTVEYSHFTR